MIKIPPDRVRSSPERAQVAAGWGRIGRMK